MHHIPNLITTFSLILGLTSIAINTKLFNIGDNSHDGIALSCHLIIICALLDKVDGYAARKLNATTKLGAQLDSLVDLITFGLAPATCLIAFYQIKSNVWLLDNSLIVFLIMVLYVVFSALRLAKFNVSNQMVNSSWFCGLPTTFAGILSATSLIIFERYSIYFSNNIIVYLPISIFGFLALLMVAPVPIPKIKKQNNKIINYMQTSGVLIIYILGAAMFLEEVIFILVVLYIVIGAVVGVKKTINV